MPSATVEVRLSERSYSIEIDAGNLAAAGGFAAERTALTHSVIITDSQVEQPHAQTVLQSFTEAGIRADLLAVPSGESSKCVTVANQLWERMLELGADRKTLVTAVGGGVVGDLAGFIAATYGRGVPFLQIPTTLLAHVDSSVGGKVGVNLPGAKNMVGAFWQPCGVLIDTKTLDTLPAREYLAGLAEVIKYGVILDAEFFAYLEQNVEFIRQRDPQTLQYVIARCCRLKADVVEGDEREQSGLRAVLNYGHTFGHAIEAVTEYGRFLHGEAVSIGMTSAARLAEALGRVDAEFVRRQHELLQNLELPTETPEDLDREALLAAMQKDKKVQHGKLWFVLPTRMGHVELTAEVPPEAARASLECRH